MHQPRRFLRVEAGDDSEQGDDGQRQWQQIHEQPKRHGTSQYVADRPLVAFVGLKRRLDVLVPAPGRRRRGRRLRRRVLDPRTNPGGRA